LYLVVVVAIAGRVTPADSRPPGDFDEFLHGVRIEATARGISEATLETALTNLQPIDRVIELDRDQPESEETLQSYVDRLLSEYRVRRGKELLREHAGFFAVISRKYGIPARYLVALWGIESNYGRESGSFPVIGALATLAWDDRRPEFYRSELLNALVILDEKVVQADTYRGSWSGATGPLQFMPSTYLTFAVDGDGDGRRDIWSNLSDAFASGAHYLAESGWQRGYSWGRRVCLPEDFDRTLTGLGSRRPIGEWRSLGVRRADGNPLPSANIDASLLLPDGGTGPAYLVYQNYRTLLRWNRSHLFALTVCHLADQLVGRTP
jgi:membrane-bound lytic murein transglycosylase B